LHDFTQTWRPINNIGLYEDLKYLVEVIWVGFFPHAAFGNFSRTLMPLYLLSWLATSTRILHAIAPWLSFGLRPKFPTAKACLYILVAALRHDNRWVQDPCRLTSLSTH
jgi:hypothetical protein